MSDHYTCKTCHKFYDSCSCVNDARHLIALEKRVEALEMIASYAQDVVAYWPKMSIRTVNIMAGKVNGLKEALDQIK
jgi:hypothetical protein